jgi:hypothetical protein
LKIASSYIPNGQYPATVPTLKSWRLKLSSVACLHTDKIFLVERTEALCLS